MASSTMENYKIIPATLDDVSLIVRLVNSAYRGEGSKQGWTTEADLLDGLRLDNAMLTEMICKAGAVVLKYVTLKDALQGCVYLEKLEDAIHLGMLTVAPDLQAKGIGKELLKAAEQYGRDNDCNTIEMTVITVRTSLINWYKRNGYYATGETKPFPMDTRFGIPKQLLEFSVMKKNIVSGLTSG